MKSEWETEGTRISKQARILDTVLASVSLMSQLAGIPILAKQKDNYASADPILITWKGANVLLLLHIHEYVRIFEITQLRSHP